MNDYLKLFKAFFYIGVFTFGGGYAMLPMLEREIVNKHRWATHEELLDFFAIGQCTPGIIAVNVATIVGYRNKGLSGAAFATLGVITPSIFIIITLAGILGMTSEIQAVSHAFAGIRIAVCVLIFCSVAKLFKGSVTDHITLIIFIISLSIMIFTQISPVVIVSLAAFTGIAISAYRNREERK